MKIVYTLGILILLGINFAYAVPEDSLQTYSITLEDGSELIGHILKEDELVVHFRTLTGIEMKLKRYLIVSLEPLKGRLEGTQFEMADPNDTRLLFAPTGRTLGKGEGYFSIYEVFFPMLAYGITDFVTISGGMSLFPGVEDQILYVAPKVRMIKSSKFEFSGGVLYSTVHGHNFGISYGVATIGDSKFSVTTGLGWGFVDGDFSKNPLFMFGFEGRISKRSKIISENWFPPGIEQGLLSLGIRFFGKKLAADFGLITSTNAEGSFPFLPWIGFAVNF